MGKHSDRLPCKKLYCNQSANDMLLKNWQNNLLQIVTGVIKMAIECINMGMIITLSSLKHRVKLGKASTTFRGQMSKPFLGAKIAYEKNGNNDNQNNNMIFVMIPHQICRLIAQKPHSKLRIVSQADHSVSHSTASNYMIYNDDLSCLLQQKNYKKKQVP